MNIENLKALRGWSKKEKFESSYNLPPPQRPSIGSKNEGKEMAK